MTDETTTEETATRWLGDEEEEKDEAEDAIPIGKALRLLRNSVGITQTEVPQRGGPDFRTISHWETGRKHPSLRLLMKYLGALGFDLHDLQSALDQIAKRPDRLTSRLMTIERRLGALERWRLDEIAASMKGDTTECDPSTETSTAS